MSASKITIPEATVVPVASATGVQIYAKDVAGVKQLFACTSDGISYPLTPAPWLPVQATVTPLAPNTNVPIVAGRINPISTTNGGQLAVFPLAASVANGTPIVVKLLNYSGSIDLVRSGADLIDGTTGLTSYLDANNACALVVSDGVSRWIIVRDSIGE
jgi:hypothetical protein